MSRLASFVTQLSSTAATNDKLANTYFRAAPAAAPITPQPLHRHQGFAALIVAAACVGIGAGWSLHASWGAFARRAMVETQPLLTFDDAGVTDGLGEQFGLWWSTPGDPRQALQLHVDDHIRTGSSGQALRVDYAMQGRVAAPMTGPAGVWIRLPHEEHVASQTALELYMRSEGSSERLHQAVIELHGQGAPERHPVLLSSAWTPVRIPLTSDQSWQEVRVLLEPQLSSTSGRLYIDQVQYVSR